MNFTVSSGTPNINMTVSTEPPNINMTVSTKLPNINLTPSTILPYINMTVSTILSDINMTVSTILPSMNLTVSTILPDINLTVSTILPTMNLTVSTELPDTNLTVSESSVNTTSTTMGTYNCPTHFPTTLRIMYVYVLPCLIFFGLVGNSLAFIVFWRQRRDKGSGDQTYPLSCLAAADNFFLVAAIFSHFLPTISKYYNQPKLFWSIYFRPTAYYFSAVTEMIASYMLLLVTVHRYLLICHPIKRGKWMTPRKVAVMMAVMVVVSVAYNVPRLFQRVVRIQYNTCLGGYFPTLVNTALGDNFIYVLVYKDILRFIFPTLIPLVGQSWLTWAIRRYLRDRPAATRTQTQKLAQVLVIISIVFLVCKIPASIRIFDMIELFFKLKQTWFNDFRATLAIFCNVLLVVNSAVNFCVYLVCGSRFRQTLREMFVYRKKEDVYEVSE